METTTRPGTPLRHRMLDDMRMRKFAEHTQDGYTRAVRKLAAFLGRSPDTATTEELRRFQLHLVDAGTGPVTINATITGLKFFFDITLGPPELMAKMQHVNVPRKLPVILSPEEVGRLIAAAPNLKHQAAMSVAYGAGFRVSEVVALKVGDIDRQRMTLRVEQGKGRKDRYAMLSPVLLERLRAWPCPGPDPGRRLAVPRHGSDRSSDGAATQPGHPPGRSHGRARQAGDAPRPAPQLRHPAAGAEGRHPRDPGAAGSQEAGDHGPVCRVATDLLRSVISPLDQTSDKPRPE